MTKSQLKSYPPPWKGQIILACRKCQNKLKESGDLAPLAKLKKTIKMRNKQSAGAQIHVLSVPCMDLCPKNAVTICNPAQHPLHLSILRAEGDIDQLYSSL